MQAAYLLREVYAECTLVNDAIPIWNHELPYFRLKKRTAVAIDYLDLATVLLKSFAFHYVHMLSQIVHRA